MVSWSAMDDSLREAAARFDERYATGDAPWDATDPPPEVAELAETLAPGRAIDIGCGRGRAALFLARRGWTVDGVDFVPRAVRQARARAEAEGLEDRARFVAASVTELPLRGAVYDLALDVGCLHRTPVAAARAYRDQLAALLRPGATFALFAHLADEDAAGPGPPRWLEEPIVYGLFGLHFVLRDVQHGTTVVRGTPFPSAWFRFERAGRST